MKTSKITMNNLTEEDRLFVLALRDPINGPKIRKVREDSLNENAVIESNLTMTPDKYVELDNLSNLSEEELFTLAFCGREMPIEEHRRIRRALAKARGITLEEELDEFEQFTNCKPLVDFLRGLLGVDTAEANPHSLLGSEIAALSSINQQLRGQ